MTALLRRIICGWFRKDNSASVSVRASEVTVVSVTQSQETRASGPILRRLVWHRDGREIEVKGNGSFELGIDFGSPSKSTTSDVVVHRTGDTCTITAEARCANKDHRKVTVDPLTGEQEPLLYNSCEDATTFDLEISPDGERIHLTKDGRYVISEQRGESHILVLAPEGDTPPSPFLSLERISEP